MKKWLLAAAVCLAAVVFTAGCGKKKEAPASSDTQKKYDISYKNLFEANRGSSLLEKYGSVRYELYLSTGIYDGEGKEIGSNETWTLFRQDGECVLMKETDKKERIVYVDGTCYYENVSNEKKPLYSMGWFMNNTYEEFMDSGVEEFLLKAESGEDFDSIEEKEDKYVLLAYVGDSDGEKYYYRYTVDRKSLEISSFEAVVQAENGDEWILSHGEIMIDTSAELPAYVNEMRQAEKNRTVVIHSEEEKDIEIKLPGNVTLLVMLEEGYGLYADKDGKKIFDDALTEKNDAGVYIDAECYLVSSKAK